MMFASEDHNCQKQSSSWEDLNSGSWFEEKAFNYAIKFSITSRNGQKGKEPSRFTARDIKEQKEAKEIKVRMSKRLGMSQRDRFVLHDTRIKSSYNPPLPPIDSYYEEDRSRSWCFGYLIIKSPAERRELWMSKRHSVLVLFILLLLLLSSNNEIMISFREMLIELRQVIMTRLMR